MNEAVLQLILIGVGLLTTASFGVLAWFAVRVVQGIDEAKPVLVKLETTMNVLVKSDEEQWKQLNEVRERNQDLDRRVVRLETQISTC